MADEAKPRLFVRNPDSGEPWAYCGTLPNRGDRGFAWTELARAFGNFIVNEVDGEFGGTVENRLTVEVKCELMTDAEVKALPDM